MAESADEKASRRAAMAAEVLERHKNDRELPENIIRAAKLLLNPIPEAVVRKNSRQNAHDGKNRVDVPIAPGRMVRGKYVVYALIDPSTGEEFYIGSGKRGRPWEHFVLAANGEIHPKAAAIRRIWESGKQVPVVIHSEHTDRASAYKEEAERISNNAALTNKLRLVSNGR